MTTVLSTSVRIVHWQLRADAAFVPGECRRVEVDAFGWVQQAGAEHPIWVAEHPAGRVPGDPPRQRNRITAVVEHGAAGQVPPHQVVGGRRTGIEPEARVDRTQLPDLTTFQETHELRNLGMDTEGEALHQEHAGLPRGVEDRGRAGGIDCNRLLAEHVLSGLRREHGELHVGGMRRRHVHELHRGIVHERLVGPVRALRPELGGECPGTGRVPASDRHQATELRLAESGREGVRDPSGAEDSPSSQFSHAASDSPAAARQFVGVRDGPLG